MNIGRTTAFSNDLFFCVIFFSEPSAESVPAAAFEISARPVMAGGAAATAAGFLPLGLGRGDVTLVAFVQFDSL